LKPKDESEGVVGDRSRIGTGCVGHGDAPGGSGSDVYDVESDASPDNVAQSRCRVNLACVQRMNTTDDDALYVADEAEDLILREETPSGIDQPMAATGEHVRRVGVTGKGPVSVVQQQYRRHAALLSLFRCC
jgi:hypothetical protein